MATKTLKTIHGDDTESVMEEWDLSDPKELTQEDLLTTLRLIFGYSEVLKQNLQNSLHIQASEDVEKINRVAWQTLTAWGGEAATAAIAQARNSKAFDAEHFMQAFSHVAHVQMSRTCKDLQFFVPQGFGTILGDEDCLLDLCTSGLDFLQATARPARLSVHLFPSQVDGKDFINLDLRAQGGELSGPFDKNFTSFFHSKNPDRIQKACEALKANFSLDVCQGRGLTFSVTFPDRTKRAQVTNTLARKDSPQSAILLLGTDMKIERMIKDLTRGSDLEILTVGHLRSGLRVFFEKQPEFVMVDASVDGWGAGELIESIRQQNKTCFIVSLVQKGMADYSEFPGADLMLEKPFKKEDLLRSMGVIGPGSRRIA
jgi:CheY-like chemotaxis protein